VLIASVLLADALLERAGDLAGCAGVTAFAALNFRERELRAILRHTELALESLREALGR
jgi:hypothetical protein